MLATFKNLPAERVPSECSQSRYIGDIFIKDIFFSGPDILSLHTVHNSLWLQKAFRSHVVSERLVEDWLLDIVLWSELKQ